MNVMFFIHNFQIFWKLDSLSSNMSRTMTTHEIYVEYDEHASNVGGSARAKENSPMKARKF